MDAIGLINRLPTIMAASASSFTFVLVLFLGGIVRRGYKGAIKWYYALPLRVLLGAVCLACGALLSPILRLGYTPIGLVNDMISMVICSALVSAILFGSARLYFGHQKTEGETWFEGVWSDKRRLSGVLLFAFFAALVLTGFFLDRGDAEGSVLGLIGAAGAKKDASCPGPRELLSGATASGIQNAEIPAQVATALSAVYSAYEIVNNQAMLVNNSLVMMLSPKTSGASAQAALLESVFCSARATDNKVCECQKAVYLIDIVAKLGIFQDK